MPSNIIVDKDAFLTADLSLQKCTLVQLFMVPVILFHAFVYAALTLPDNTKCKKGQYASHIAATYGCALQRELFYCFDRGKHSGSSFYYAGCIKYNIIVGTICNNITVIIRIQFLKRDNQLLEHYTQHQPANHIPTS